MSPANTFFQIKKMNPKLRQGIKAVAAMQGMTMQDWVIKVLTAEVRKHIDMEEE